MRWTLPFILLQFIGIVTIGNGQTCETSQSEESYMLPTTGPLANVPTPPGPHLVGTVAGFEAWTEGLKLYETPVALRFAHLIDVLNWNCAAIYSQTWKDAITKSNTLLHTPATIDINGNDITLHTSDTRLLCIVNAWATVVDDWVPEAAEPLLGLLQAFEYPDVQIGFDPEIDSCFEDGGVGNISCLENIAQDRCYRPSTIGSIVGRQVTEYARRDGWNMYGTVNSDGTPCTANCRRFTDPTGYASRGDRLLRFEGSSAKNSAKKSWKPMLEDNGRGYFTRQEHVTPHIGKIAKTWILDRDDFKSRKAPPPNYNYDKESSKVFERLAALDDTKKMLIEFFDDKIKVAFLVIEAVAKQGASYEEILNFVVGYTAGEYDSILLAWKEKVRYNLVRPTTWIQEQMEDKDIETWAGPGQGTKTFKGKNFEAYVRVMPHSEYVSGSGCICQAAYEFTDVWLKDNLDISDSIPLQLPEFIVGSSKTEPNITPATNVTIDLQNMEALRDACGESRLDGGMHFTASVEASYKLCEGVGVKAARFARDLW
mmetsp:Transcript_26657/g.37568  ORF Transcript_26657/g.37568 Transcript_26657/m.37568 type:complete len:541 (+) Transcript_26657:113-1735(+)